MPRTWSLKHPRIGEKSLILYPVFSIIFYFMTSSLVPHTRYLTRYLVPWSQKIRYFYLLGPKSSNFNQKVTAEQPWPLHVKIPMPHTWSLKHPQRRKDPCYFERTLNCLSSFFFLLSSFFFLLSSFLSSHNQQSDFRFQISDCQDTSAQLEVCAFL